LGLRSRGRGPGISDGLPAAAPQTVVPVSRQHRRRGEGGLSLLRQTLQPGLAPLSGLGVDEQLARSAGDAAQYATLPYERAAGCAECPQYAHIDPDVSRFPPRAWLPGSLRSDGHLLRAAHRELLQALRVPGVGPG